MFSCAVRNLLRRQSFDCVSECCTSIFPEQVLQFVQELLTARNDDNKISDYRSCKEVGCFKQVSPWIQSGTRNAGYKLKEDFQLLSLSDIGVVCVVPVSNENLYLKFCEKESLPCFLRIYEQIIQAYLFIQEIPMRDHGDSAVEPRFAVMQRENTLQGSNDIATKLKSNGIPVFEADWFRTGLDRLNDWICGA